MTFLSSMPPIDRGKALSLLFRGYSTRSVGGELGCSHVTVSNLLQRFISEAEKEGGILAVVDKYGIAEQVKGLIAIGAAVEETKVDASKAPLGLRIVNEVELFGVDAEGAPAFIEVSYAEAVKQGMSPESFVKTVKGLKGWLIGDKSDYQILLNDVESKHREFEELDDKVYEYEQKAAAAKSDGDKAIKEKNTTLVELKQFIALRDALGPLGLDLRDVEKAKNCVSKIAEKGGDSEAVFAFYSRSVDLSKKLDEDEARVGYLNKQELIVGNKLKKVEEVLAEKSALVEKVKEADALGLRPSQLGVLVEATHEVGARHGYDNKQSILKLEEDVKENWEPKLGFENEKTSQEAKLNALNERIKLAEERERVTVENAQAQEQALKGLMELRKHVSPAELIEFKRIIVDSGVEESAFRDEIARFGDIHAAVESAKQRGKAEVAELQSKAATLGAEVTQLADEKKKLEAKIDLLHSQDIIAIREASKAITETANRLKLDFEDPDTGYLAEMTRIREESVSNARSQFKAEREAIIKNLEGLKGFFSRTVSEVEKIKNDTWKVGVLVGFSIHLKTLVNLVAGKQVRSEDSVPTMIMTVEAFEDHLIKNSLASRCPSCWQFRKELEKIVVG